VERWCFPSYMLSLESGCISQGRRNAKVLEGSDSSQSGVISAIILAAGSSSRMGVPKQLLKLGRVTVLEQVLKTFRASKADEVLVVLGVRSVKRGRLLGARVVVNPDSSGISSSISVGLGAIDRNSEAVLFGLADKPFVSVGTVNRIIESYQTSRIGIVIPVYRGTRGNPVLFAREFFDELRTLSGDVGGKAVIRRHAESVRELEVDDDGILVDIDTRADFERAKARFVQLKRRPPR